MIPVLTDTIKDAIQGAYRTWLATRAFSPRRGQKEMIAAIARTLAAPAPRLAVVEAGTGTGKTAAYCLAAIPLAQNLGKTVVISTATIALQEQVVLQDLPDIKANAALEFGVTLAKGRGRYLCLKRLDDNLRDHNQQEMLASEASAEEHTALYQSMLGRFSKGVWDGEMDSWPDAIPETAKSALTTDHRGCSNNRCSFFKQCPFFRARARLEGAEVIVANHDLVLADLALGGGAILPEPEECIFIIDEAHHIADKTQNHFSSSARLNATIQWLDSVNTTLGSMAQQFSQPKNLVSLATQTAADTDALGNHLHALAGTLEDMPFESKEEDKEAYRFPMGQVPDATAELCRACLPSITRISDALEQTHDLLSKAMSGELDWPQAYAAEDWLLPVGQLLGRAQSVETLLQDYADGDAKTYRHARWLSRNPYDVEMVSAPIEPGHILQRVLWDRCFAAVCTSATITALGKFDRFIERAGLGDEAITLSIASPFDYGRIATFQVPDMAADPRDFDGHSAEIVSLLPELLQQHPSALVLFTSWRQLNAVIKGLPDALVSQLLVQGEGSKQALIAQHKERIDDGKTSYLFGLASFSEGLDLPGAYCRHVIIAKLPFSVPDNPIDQAIAEWAEAQGRNAFYEITVPDAALKLVQACGRLIRHEADFGTISMLDKRIVTQRYGRALIQSLPPFRLDLPGTQ